MKGLTTLVMLVTLVFAGIASFYFLEHQRKGEQLAASLDNIAQLQEEFRKIEAQLEQARQNVAGNGDAVAAVKAEAEKWQAEARRLLEDRGRLEKQVEELSGRLVAAMARVTPPSLTAVPPAGKSEPPAPPPAASTNLFGEVKQALKAAVARGDLLVREKASGRDMAIAVPSRSLFGPGPADLKDEGKAILRQVAGAIKASGEVGLRVEGHTDNIPMGPKYREQFPTNQELSDARARIVASFLAAEAGIEPARISAAGFADSKPLADNASAEGRAKNSRIEIVPVR